MEAESQVIEEMEDNSVIEQELLVVPPPSPPPGGIAGLSSDSDDHMQGVVAHSLWVVNMDACLPQLEVARLLQALV